MQVTAQEPVQTDEAATAAGSKPTLNTAEAEVAQQQAIVETPEPAEAASTQSAAQAAAAEDSKQVATAEQEPAASPVTQQATSAELPPQQGELDISAPAASPSAASQADEVAAVQPEGKQEDKPA